MSRNFLSCDTDEANELDGREQKRSVAFLVRLAEQLSRLRESKGSPNFFGRGKRYLDFEDFIKSSASDFSPRSRL